MSKWKDVTNSFSTSQRFYKNVYLEKCEVLDECIEVSLFSSDVDPYEIYVSFGKMYGIIYSNAQHAESIVLKVKEELEKEYKKNEKPSNQFINYFAEKYKLVIPHDIFFDMDDFFGFSWK